MIRTWLCCCLALAVGHAAAAVDLQAIVRGVCAIIDAFHFDISSQISAVPEGAEAQAETEESLQDQAEAESAHKEIQSALTRRVLPSLRAQLVHDGEVSPATQFLCILGIHSSYISQYTLPTCVSCRRIRKHTSMQLIVVKQLC